MTIRVAITGFGRIGRNVLRAHYEGGKKHDVEIVAINAPGDLASTPIFSSTTPATAASTLTCRSKARTR